MRTFHSITSLWVVLAFAIGAPNLAAARDVTQALTVIENLTSVLAEDIVQSPPPADGAISPSEQALGNAFLQTPVAWLVMGDSFKEATPTQKREAIGYLRKYWTKMLLGVYETVPDGKQRRTSIESPTVDVLSSADDSRRTRRLDALCSYTRLRTDCHSVIIRTAVGPQTAGSPPVEIVYELMPAPNGLQYQVFNVDVLGISLTDSVADRLRGKSITDVLALLQRAAAPRN